MAAASQQLYEELLSCSSEVSYEKVKFLLKNDADPCSQFGATKSSPLFLCIERNDETLLHLLLRHAQKRNLGITNADGVNALMLAAKLGFLGCLNLLLSSGFTAPELINKRSRPSGLVATALMLAFIEGHVDIARVLLQNGADPTLLDSRGRSLAHIAAIRGQLELLQELKQHGVEFNQVVDGLGNTPMHFCTHSHVLEFLHKEGLSPTTRNKQGSTPLDILKRMHADPGVTALLQHLQEEELRRSEGVTTAWEKFSQSLRWMCRDVVRELGWKVTLLVVVVICIAAWQLTVYLHGKSPFIASMHNKML